MALDVELLLSTIKNTELFGPDNNYDKNKIITPGKTNTVTFIPSDSYGNLADKLKKYSRELDVYNKFPLSYTLNKQGFRSDIDDYESLFNEEVDIILGCSFTFGIGFHTQHTWPYILKKLENNKIPQIHLGVPGTGGDTSFRLLATYLKKFKKVRRVLHLQPFYARFEIIQDDTAFNFLATSLEVSEFLKEHYSKKHRQTVLANERVHIINHVKNVTACKGLADMHNVPYFHLGFGNSVMPKYMYEIYARDIDHGGFTGQFHIANLFLTKLQDNDTDIEFGLHGDRFLSNEYSPKIYEMEFDYNLFLDYINSNPEVKKFYPNEYYTHYKNRTI